MFQLHQPPLTWGCLLHYKVRGKLPTVCTMGPSSVLSSEEKQILVRWITELSIIQYPITKVQLFDSVEFIVKSLKELHPLRTTDLGKMVHSFFKEKF